jgi:hypothetical protein
MTANRNLLVLLALSLVVLLASLACRNPLQVGLGDQVDIDRPVVSLDAPELGSFLRGDVLLKGPASDDTQVAAVQVAFKFAGDSAWGPWQDVDLYDPAQERWQHELATQVRPNGRLAVMVRVRDNSGKQAVTQELLFTIDNEAPNIILTFPAINPATYNPDNPPTVGKNGAIFGTVVDRDAIAFEYPKIRFWRMVDPEPADWTTLRPGDVSSPAVYDFRYSVPANQVGDYYLRVIALDTGGEENVLPLLADDPYRVVIVSGTPQVAFSAPQQADDVRGIRAIQGSMSHETGQQPDIELRFFERNNAVPLLTVAAGSITVTPNGGAFDWSYNLNSSSLPDGTIIAQAFAHIGESAGFDSLVFNVDNELPSIAASTPGYLDTVYSTVVFRGTASDNGSLAEVAIKVGSDDYLVLAGTYNWQHSIDTNVYGNSSHAQEWNPQTNLPQAGTQVWRLPVLLRATDVAGNQTEITHRVYIDQDLDKPTVNILSPLGGSNLAGPVLVTGTAFDADPGVNLVQMQILAVDDSGELIGNLTPAGDALGADSWYTVSGGTQWSQEINANGKLYSVTSSGGAYYPNALAHNGRLRLRIRAIDLGGKVGNFQELGIRLDNTIPTITSISPASGSYANGVFQLTATVQDDEEIASVSVSTDGGTTYTEVYSGLGLGLRTYNLNRTIDTGPSGLNIVSQVRNLRIRVRDNANYTTISTVALNVDNYWPDGELDASIFDPMTVQSSTYQIRGNAWDRDKLLPDNQYPVRGIDSIQVYFEDRRSGSPTFGKYYRLAGGATADAVLENLGNGQGLQPTMPSAAHKILIDRSHLGSLDFKAIEVDGSDSSWWARFDSTALPDGAMNVHFLITDRAGNRTHRSEPGFVRNNPPAIGIVSVGTDLNYDNTVSLGERFDYSVRFNARGRLYLLPAIGGGNGSPTYQIFNAADMGTPLSLTADTLDISNTGTYPDGDYTFVIRVTDSVGIQVDRNILVAIAQSDSQAPEISIEEVPTTVASQGHVEATSPLNAGRPSVSGTVTVAGTASDNQRIQEIRITVPGLGTNVLAASWVGAPTHNLVSQLAGFTVASSLLDQAGGHTVSWSYSWNSAAHPSRAAEGVVFAMSVQDFRSGSPPASTANRTYDVVPYIRLLGTQLSAAYPSAPSALNRTALGRYPVRRGEIIDIHGFNFDGASTAVTINGVSAGTVTSVQAWTQLQITVPGGATSGALLATVSGVPSINNLNGNGLAHNQEPNNVNNNTLVDDRLLDVWGFTNGPAGSSTATYPIMRVNPANNNRVFSYALTSSFYVGTAGSTTQYERAFNNYTWNTLAFDSSGGVYAASSNASRPGEAINSAARASFYTRGRTSNDNTSENTTLQNTKRQFESNYDGTLHNVFRVQNLDLAVSGAGIDANPAKAHLVYYDENQRQVKFRYGSIGTTATTINPSTLGYNLGDTFTNAAPGSAPNYHVVAGSTTSGPYVAVGVVPAGQPGAGTAVVAWYDTTSQSLKISYNTNPSGATEAQWGTNVRTVDSGFAGQYVDLAVDNTGGIHLAYYSSAAGDLKYAYFSDYLDATPDIAVVDTFLSVGSNLMIQVYDDGTNIIPYISYYFGSFVDTRHCLRLAYRNFAAGALGDGASLDRFTGKWEVSSVPVANVPKNYVVSMGLLSTGVPVLGFATSANLETAQRF